MKIGITLGDIAGIGPEISVKALAHFGRMIPRPKSTFVLIGPANVIGTAAAHEGVDNADVKIYDTGFLDDKVLYCGRQTAETGAASHIAVETAVRMALDGSIDAIVTAPISKTAWNLAGYSDPGHTELIGRMAAAEPVMAFIGRLADGEVLRVALATIHEPLARVPELINRDLVERTLRILANDLRIRFGVESPRIGVAGLNPHAGESGRIGREEAEQIAPAVAQVREEGIEAEGPFPGDAIFSPRMRRKFDLILAMYHDQGLAPFKALTSGSGVNVTLGLPLIRTSPDHGTAFDIAGQSRADCGSMIEAVRLAIEIVERKKTFQA